MSVSKIRMLYFKLPHHFDVGIKCFYFLFSNSIVIICATNGKFHIDFPKRNLFNVCDKIKVGSTRSAEWKFCNWMYVFTVTPLLIAVNRVTNIKWSWFFFRYFDFFRWIFRWRFLCTILSHSHLHFPHYVMWFLCLVKLQFQAIYFIEENKMSFRFFFHFPVRQSIDSDECRTNAK